MTQEFDDQLLTMALRRQLFDEIEGLNKSFWLVVQRSNGLTVEKSEGPIVVDEARQVFSHELVHALNVGAGYEGRWVVAWIEPFPITRVPSRMVMLWKDPDGDVPFVVDCVNTLDELYRNGPLVLVAQCDAAYHAYWQHIRDVGVKSANMRKFAQGQRRAQV